MQPARRGTATLRQPPPLRPTGTTHSRLSMETRTQTVSLIVIFLVSMVMVMNATVSPSASRLSGPCGDDDDEATVGWDDLSILEELRDRSRTQVDRDYSHISHIARDTAERIYGLMQTFVDERFGNPLLGEQLRAFHLDGMPRMNRLMGLTNGQVQAATAVRRTHEFVSRVGLFLEQVLLDELEYEVENGTQIHDDLEFLLQHRLQPLRCRLERTLLDLSRSGSQNQVSAFHVPNARIRDMPIARLRYARDYIILRDSRTLFTSITAIFATMRENNEQTNSSA